MGRTSADDVRDDWSLLTEEERRRKADELIAMIRELREPPMQPPPLVYRWEEAPDEPEPGGIALTNSTGRWAERLTALAGTPTVLLERCQWQGLRAEPDDTVGLVSSEGSFDPPPTFLSRVRNLGPLHLCRADGHPCTRGFDTAPPQMRTRPPHGPECGRR